MNELSSSSEGRAHEPPVPAGTEQDDGLAALRSLLLQPERTELDGLRERFENPDLLAGDVSRVLAEAIILRAREDDELTHALQPVLVETIRTAVREDPEFIADAIYPVLGPAIRKAVASALRSFAQSLNSTVNAVFSLRGLKWRFEAWRTRRPFADVVLRHTLVYRVEQVFLIHRATGLVLQHVTLPEVENEDPEVVGAMLSAIQDYTRDSFGAGSDEAVSALQIGELTVWVEKGPYAVLAAVVWGIAPNELRRAMQETLEAVHRTLSDRLIAFDGDTAPFSQSRPDLEACLLSETVHQPPRLTA